MQQNVDKIFWEYAFGNVVAWQSWCISVETSPYEAFQSVVVLNFDTVIMTMKQRSFHMIGPGCRKQPPWFLFIKMD